MPVNSHRQLKYSIAFILLLLFPFSMLYAQKIMLSPHTNTKVLADNGKRLQQKWEVQQERAFALAKKKGWKTFHLRKDGNIQTLVGIDDFGLPIYEITESNAIAAATTQANKLYTGGGLGLSLSGSTIPEGKVALFEGSSPLTTHQEFAGGRIVLKDATSYGSHATHTAGTIMASGVNAIAKGMVYALPQLWAFTSSNDSYKMNNNSNTLLLSNHSYGTNAGWDKDDDGKWRFLGAPGATEDYKFGWYNDKAQEWDNICYNAPYYLPLKSGGNYRGSNGPAVGANYYNSSGTLVGPRPAGMSSNDSYGTVATYGTAKNILSVGAVYGLPNGSNSPADVTMSSFSAWGPTDDGRIKPDLVADGVSVISSDYTSNTAYASKNGTSMSTPNATGTLALLQELYYQKNSAFMRSSTLKALVLGTTSEAGPSLGPDYKFGWGLLNAENAAKAILGNGTTSILQEKSLSPNTTETITIVASGTTPLVATICWTDPAATYISSSQALNRPDLRLINDLDMRANDGTTTYYPWILDPANPSAAATTGDNFRDNVEQIYVANPVAGKTYTFTIGHKNSLKNNLAQAFGIVITGAGGNVYCASAPSSNADSKITNFSFANINNSPTTTCTNYSDFTAQTAQVEKGKTYTLSLSAGTCGAINNKVTKVYIDWNADGDFDDSGELVATSNVIADNGSFTTNITVPSTVVVNTHSRIRVVLAETANANDIAPCGTYAKGETQDYAITFTESNTLYVKKGSTGDGSSWENAIGEVGDALNLTLTRTNITQIWVAAGTYKPTVNPVSGSSDDKDKTFAFPARTTDANGLKLYGGFNGTETALEQRNWKLNKTILSGDLSGNDEVTGSGTTLNITNQADNVYHVVVGYDYGVLDGFEITGGCANGTNSASINSKNLNRYYGGGFIIYDGSAKMTIANCVFYANASGGGSDRGGATYFFNAKDISFTNTVFYSNLSRTGGAMYVNLSSSSASKFTVTNSLFAGNLSTSAAGSAIQFNSGNSVSENYITNCTFFGNASTNSGSAVYLTSTSPATIKNTIFWNNTGGSKANIYKSTNSTPQPISVANCIFPSGSSTDAVTGVVTYTGISNSDPLFRNAGNLIGADGLWMTDDDGLSIKANSPAIGAGSPDVTEPEYDITGYLRPTEVLEEDVLGKFSLGAYEFNAVLPVTLQYFTATAHHSDVKLIWAVASSLNFNRFEVERSSDGISFSKIADKVFNGIGSYTHSDEGILAKVSGYVYYRLKMIDNDGSYTYSDIQAVKGKSLVADGIMVYPNPFDTELKLRFDIDTSRPVKVSIASVDGKVVYSREFSARTIIDNLVLQQLDHLKNGLYILSVQNGTDTYRVKVIKK